MANKRMLRIAEEFKKALSFIIHDEIKDPRISAMASVTRVELSRDLKYAKAYVSVYDAEERQKSTMDALRHAEGFIKKKIGEAVKMRSMPAIAFVFDDSIAYGMHMSSLIDKVVKDAGK